MSSARRQDLVEEGRPATSDPRAFKKDLQTEEKPLTPLTSGNINDQYFRDPPNVRPFLNTYYARAQANLRKQNQPIGTSTGRSDWTVEEGAVEDLDPKQEGVLGDQDIGKQTKEAALGEIVNDSTVHGGM